MASEVPKNAQSQVSNKIFTAANVVSFLRLCLVPLFVGLILNRQHFAAAAIFALAASTDFVDGQIARRTGTVTKLGQLLDPAVDRLLMLSGVLALTYTGALPLWILVLVLVRDTFMLIGGSYLMKTRRIRVPVIFIGKLSTACLFFGFVGLLLQLPLVPAVGLLDTAWLPGLNFQSASWGIYFVYAGLILSAFSTSHYLKCAIYALRHEDAYRN